jgi:HpcH/HpaI aldolase/citrate lyase family
MCRVAGGSPWRYSVGVAPRFEDPWDRGGSDFAVRNSQADGFVGGEADWRLCNHANQICFALDAGARGIVVPMVNTRAEAEAAVRACRYYPLGSRSNAGYAASGASSRITAITLIP